MSRTTLCLVTAAVLAAVSVGLTIARRSVLGDEVKRPHGPGTWKVTMLASGKTSSTDARLQTATPLDFGHQHIVRENCHSAEMANKPPVARHPERRQVLWSPRAGVADKQFR